VIPVTANTKMNIEYTLSTFTVEGLNPSDFAIEIFGRLDEGKISLSDAIKAIESKHKLKTNKGVQKI